MPHISKKEFAQWKGVSKQAISQAAKRGKLRTKKVLRMLEVIDLTDAEYGQYRKWQALS